MSSIKIVFGALALLFSSTSHSTIIYDDGFIHIVNSVSEDIALERGCLTCPDAQRAPARVSATTPNFFTIPVLPSCDRYHIMV